jgi:hypothetical protein
MMRDLDFLAVRPDPAEHPARVLLQLTNADRPQADLLWSQM